jgi:excisionase family DNA binding protein
MRSREQEYLTTQEAAEILKVTPQTIMNMVRRGQLRGKKVGVGGISSPWRIPKEEVIRYVELEEEKSGVEAST